VTVSQGRDWYLDAIVYELHVRAFSDSDGDGIGDFNGLTSKLDYLQDLGVTALWLLPFYPSPLRDEGYDIADYRGVNPIYGRMRDFRRFLDGAHRRGLRVITELVLNHTSDQHPWFQRARRAPRGSRTRDWYVWSDDPNRYADARIIFQDFEHSNWTWDPVAGQYYWHRFYAHQPDLNFDSPDVRRAMLRTVDHWFELGVDGLRLDAVPYLFEREGTNGENLPETHAFLRSLRAHVDARFGGDKMVLAEANQWPEDAVAYFGNGDECHMAFHFPLMPRLFMGLRMEDRFPIVDILRQTPDIPHGAQWAIFLRNHDELTLEMVTDEERDYMWRVYARDPAMRINLGIRRRLAPLLQHHRQKIELMHGLLCSLPGTPVLYYGDEIGMGDNVYLGDRDGVRTPMQWSADRNAGFSSANPQRLYLPLVIDPEYHYETVNVAAQIDNPDSLLWWVRRLLALRRRYAVFGRGAVELLAPDNYRVFAFVRQMRDEESRNGEAADAPVLVVANLSRFAQYVELDLSHWRGASPRELFGNTEFPSVTERPYPLTLGPHAFFWLALEPARHEQITAGARRRPPIVRTEARSMRLLESSARAFELALPDVLRASRWFGGKDRFMTAVRIEDCFDVPMIDAGGARPAWLIIVTVEFADGEPATYAVPVVLVPADGADEFPSDAVLVEVEAADGSFRLVDATSDPAFGAALAQLIARRRRIEDRGATIAGAPVRRGALTHELPRPTPVGKEQSNTSLVFGSVAVMKLVRRLEPGESPELEITRALSSRAPVPALLGALEYRPRRGLATTLAVVHEFVAHETTGFEWFLSAADREAEDVLAHAPEGAAQGAAEARLLGQRVGELHRALATVDDPRFRAEPMGALARRSLAQSLRTTSQRAIRALRVARSSLPEPVATWATTLVDHADAVQERLGAVARVQGGTRIRVHGDLHLGQVLWTGCDFVIIDFEGEPLRSISERRLRRPALRDVAGMIRSFDYAGRAALDAAVAHGRVNDERRGEEQLGGELMAWTNAVSDEFLDGYLATVRPLGLLPSSDEDLRVELDAHVLEKALYEVSYELSHRPSYVGVPLRAALRLVGLPIAPPPDLTLHDSDPARELAEVH
jgi:maltose alpha-D-glucosyltransferase/alpha-amylase